jgi:3-aminobutyryl-CoA ammonia-lyase
METTISLRMCTADGHYAGGLVDGARILQLFGDAVTEALIRHDGDEGLMRVMNAEFLEPVLAGDFLEVKATLLSTGRTSRKFECTARKVIQLVDPEDSAADVLPEPLLAVRAEAVAVVPADKQRVTHE